MSDGFTMGHLVTPTGISRKVDLATDNVGQWPHLISGLCLLFCPAPRPAQTAGGIGQRKGNNYKELVIGCHMGHLSQLR